MVESRARKSVRNIAYRICAQLCSVLLKFVSRTIFIRVLSVEYLGINGLFSEVLSMLAMADLGFGTAMVFSMYKPLAEKDSKKLSQLVALYKKIYRVIALTIGIIGLALIPLLKYLVNLPANIPYLTLYYVLYLANTVASYLVVYKTCILNADQKSYLLAKYDTIFNLISTVLCSVLLIITHSFIVYLLVQVILTYTKNFYESHIAEKQYPYINQKVEKLPKDECKSIFENIKSIFIYKIATTLVGSTDNMLISVLIGTVFVGYYSNYSMVIANVSLFINLLFSSVTASLGNLIVESNKEKNYSVYKTMQYISFMLSTFVITCMFCLLNDFISVWLGQSFVLDKIVVISIILNMYFSVVLMPIWSYREATGMYKQTKYVMVATAAINLVTSIVLGKLIGLAGIFFATSISRLTTYFWYEPKLLFAQYFGKNIRKYYISIGMNIVKTLCVAVVSFAIVKMITPDGWLGFFGKLGVTAIVSLMLTGLAYCKNPEMRKVFEIGKRVISR